MPSIQAVFGCMCELSIQHVSRKATIRRIQDADFERRRPAWQRLPEEVQGLVCDLLVTDEQARLSSGQALVHAWMEPNSLSSMTPTGAISDTVSSFAPMVLASLRHFSQLDGIQRLTLATCAMIVSESDVMAISRTCGGPWRRGSWRRGIAEVARRAAEL